MTEAITTFLTLFRKSEDKYKKMKSRFSACAVYLMYLFLQILKKLYKECGLVHADLSEYNILWHNDQAWIIDVSQAVDITHPAALEFLYRDCSSVSRVSTIAFRQQMF